MVIHADDEPVTWKDLRRIRAQIKALDERISECFAAFQEGDATQSGFWDEHEDKINRLTRSLRRLDKRTQTLEEMTFAEGEQEE